MFKKALCIGTVLISFGLNAQIALPKYLLEAGSIDVEEALVGEWTSMVAIIEKSRNYGITAHCKGALIDKDWMLTTERCARYKSPEQYEIATGIYIEGEAAVGTLDEIIDFTDIYIYEDIALLKLKTNSTQAVIPLYAGGSELVGLDAKIIDWDIKEETGDNYGYVYSYTLLQGNAKISDCKVPSDADHSYICTNLKSIHPSGAPLYIDIKGQKVLAGITIDEGMSTQGVAVNLSLYKDFIEKYVTPAYVSGSGEVIEASEIMGAVSGLWFDQDLPGIGFNFIQAAQGLGVYYYGYRDDGSSLWLLNNADIGPTNINKGQSYQLDLNQPTLNNGGNFTTAPTTDATGTSAWGTVELTFTGCNTATAHLTGDDGEISLNLIRLTSIQGTSCID